MWQLGKPKGNGHRGLAGLTSGCQVPSCKQLPVVLWMGNSLKQCPMITGPAYQLLHLGLRELWEGAAEQPGMAARIELAGACEPVSLGS